MVSLKHSVIAGGALILGLSTAPSLQGSGNGAHTNVITFGGAVRLPGVTLIPGRYIFEQFEATQPGIVVVRSADRSRHYFLGWTNRVTRTPHEGPDHVVTLGEAARGGVPPILAWYPRGERNGFEFIYAR